MNKSCVVVFICLLLVGALRPVIVSGLPQPAWWGGECNVDNNPGSYKLDSSYAGVDACGPLPGSTWVDLLDSMLAPGVNMNGNAPNS